MADYSLHSDREAHGPGYGRPFLGDPGVAPPSDDYPHGRDLGMAMAKSSYPQTSAVPQVERIQAQAKRTSSIFNHADRLHSEIMTTDSLVTALFEKLANVISQPESIPVAHESSPRQEVRSAHAGFLAERVEQVEQINSRLRALIEMADL